MTSSRALLVLAALALACSAPSRRGGRGGDDGSSGTDGGGQTACSAGSQIACTCADGSAGTATCAADGSRYGVCACGGGELCTPGATNTCTCANGSGTTTCLPDGSGWAPCECQSQDCQPTSLSAVGDVGTSGGFVDFTGGTVQATFGHRRGADQSAGCIAKASFLVAKGGCALSLTYGAVQGGSGGLKAATFQSDGSCGTAGTFHSVPGYGPTWFTGAASIPNASAAASCANATIGFSSDVVPLFDASGSELDLALDGLVLSGHINSAGDPSLVCVEPACGGAYHEANGWCVTGGCGPGQHDGGDGACVETGTCSPGYALTSDGSCAAQAACQASIAAPTVGTVGTAVTLDGSGSRGSGSETFQWTLARPAGSGATLQSTSAPATSFVPDREGDYLARLTVTDGGCTSAAEATIHVSPSATTGHKLEVLLTWLPHGSTAPGGDLDLHLRGPAAPAYPSEFFDPANQADCYYGNCKSDPGFPAALDWGAQNTVAPDGLAPNDPTLDQDSFWGGPESISIPAAFDGVFVAGVNYYCREDVSNTSNALPSTTAMDATVTVSLDGVPVGSESASIPAEGDLWEAAVITVSGGGTHVAVAPSAAAIAPSTASGSNCGF